MSVKRIIWNQVLLGFCLLAFLFPSGCASPPLVNTAAVQQTPLPHEFERAAWEDGLMAFKDGDYKKAASVFEALSLHSRLPETARKAVFARAAALLAMAQTSDEYEQAASLWDQWSKQAQSGLEGEDPRMLTPFVGRAISQACKNGTSASQPQKAQKDAPNPNLKNALQSKEREVDGLRAKLDSREREIRRLRQQLESLEEIHRKYQEKKQEASAP